MDEGDEDLQLVFRLLRHWLSIWLSIGGEQGKVVLLLDLGDNTRSNTTVQSSRCVSPPPHTG